MKALEGRSSSRLSLGQAFQRKAGVQNIPEYYLMAMREFQRATDYDNNSIWALTNFGYAFWQYRLAYPDTPFPKWLQSDKWLGPYIGLKAELAARRAYALATNLDSEEDRVSVQSTLGEVLLGKARSAEAIEVLEKVLKGAPANAFYDENRWDMSQAYACDSASKRGDAADRVHAAELLRTVTQNAVDRNDRLWLYHNYLLDPQALETGCKPYPDEVDRDPQARFMLQTGSPTYSASEPCNWTGVFATVTPLTGTVKRSFLLRVWGGQLDAFMNVSGKPREHVLLTLEPKNSENYYFAQLWTRSTDTSSASTEQPVSDAYPIPDLCTCRDNMQGQLDPLELYSRARKPMIGKTARRQEQYDEIIPIKAILGNVSRRFSAPERGVRWVHCRVSAQDRAQTASPRFPGRAGVLQRTRPDRQIAAPQSRVRIEHSID